MWSLWKEGRGLQAATNAVHGCFSEELYDTALFCDLLQCFTSFQLMPPLALADSPIHVCGFPAVQVAMDTGCVCGTATSHPAASDVTDRSGPRGYTDLCGGHCPPQIFLYHFDLQE